MDEFQIAVYSDNARTRQAVLAAIGTGNRSPMRIRSVEVATAAALERRMGAGGVDLAILDAEARPIGGLGLARQLKDEIEFCPPLVVLIARSADTWLARWSRADGALMQPIDSVQLAKVTMALLRHPAAAQRDSIRIAAR
ncbi:response regulator [soil metagenome]